MTTYPLVGGPCDGQRSPTYTLRPPIGLVYSCAGTRYLFTANGTFAAQSADATLDAATALGTRQLGQAWSRFTRALGVHAPHAIRRSKAARKRLRRVVR